MKWNEVTWYSKLGALILFLLVVPVLAFVIGRKYQEVQDAYQLVAAVKPPHLPVQRKASAPVTTHGMFMPSGVSQP